MRRSPPARRLGSRGSCLSCAANWGDRGGARHGSDGCPRERETAEGRRLKEYPPPRPRPAVARRSVRSWVGPHNASILAAPAGGSKASCPPAKVLFQRIRSDPAGFLVTPLPPPR